MSLQNLYIDSGTRVSIKDLVSLETGADVTGATITLTVKDEQLIDVPDMIGLPMPVDTNPNSAANDYAVTVPASAAVALVSQRNYLLEFTVDGDIWHAWARAGYYGGE